MLFAESPPVLSLVHEAADNATFGPLASRSSCWWATSARAADLKTASTLRNIGFAFNTWPTISKPTTGWLPRLDTLQAVEADPQTQVVKKAWIHPRGEAPLAVMGYAWAPAGWAAIPPISVVGLKRRSHEVGNLTVAEPVFFPSCPGLSPA